MRRVFLVFFAVLLLVGFGVSLRVEAQTITAALEGHVVDSSGAAIPGAKVTAVNASTGISRSTTTDAVGEYHLGLLPVGEYSVTVERGGFQRTTQKISLLIGQTATLDFTLQVGQVTQQVVVEAGGALVEPTRSTVSTVIVQQQIESLPVNGRQFIDFALLAPGVQIGETTSGSTDVIVEPVTKLAFGGQNIHYNFVAIDGADNMSTASGIQKTTPSQAAVQEFQVINSTYSTEFGRAVGGIVNIVTHSGTNDLHGSAYEYFRNDALDATSILAAPGLTKLQQNQFGVTLGGPFVKDRTFFFGNYEGQRRNESPFYNSALLANIGPVNPDCTAPIDTINAAKACVYGLPTENLNVTRRENSDNFLFKVDHAISQKHLFTGRYFFNDGRYTNQSPLNDGFDSPSTFRNNFFRDQSLVGNLTSTFSPTFLNTLRAQYARRTFDFPSITAEPHMEIVNVFTTGVNRGNPDFYRESRFELVDNVTMTHGKHTVTFGGDFNFVRTSESFPLFAPFEPHFNTVADYINQNPGVIFFEKFAPGATALDPALFPFPSGGFPQSIRDAASTRVDHLYNGFFVQDKWRASERLTLNYGVRYEWENWPHEWISNDLNNVDPRFGFAYNVGTKKNFVIRGGAGLFHGIIPAPLLLCQQPSCGGIGPFPGREGTEDALNARAPLFAFASIPPQMQAALQNLFATGTFPTVTLPGVDFLGVSTIVRFAQHHQAPYGIQMSLGFEVEPVKDFVIDVSYLRVKGVHLGSFFNVNQPDPNTTPAIANLLFHDSNGNTATKDRFYALCFDPPTCSAFVPGVRDFITPHAVYFEADSRWSSVFDGLLVNARKRFSNHFGGGLSYTWSKTIDNGPNPSFVLIPQETTRFDLERAVSSDSVKHRFVANGTITGPTDMNPVVNDWALGLILTLQSPHYFTKFAGFDANGDVFDVNDRVGIEPRNTFKGDGLYSLDLRVSRTVHLGEKAQAEFIAEAFNIFNTLNVRFYNTVYGAADFCNVAATADPVHCAGTLYQEGSPNPAYGTPRAINNPRQIQLAIRLSF